VPGVHALLARGALRLLLAQRWRREHRQEEQEEEEEVVNAALSY
jgi:hypothetical protein